MSEATAIVSALATASTVDPANTSITETVTGAAEPVAPTAAVMPTIVPDATATQGVTDGLAAAVVALPDAERTKLLATVAERTAQDTSPVILPDGGATPLAAAAVVADAGTVAAVASGTESAAATAVSAVIPTGTDTPPVTVTGAVAAAENAPVVDSSLASGISSSASPSSGRIGPKTSPAALAALTGVGITQAEGGRGVE